MKRHIRPAVTTALLVLAAALLFSSGLLTAGASPASAPAIAPGQPGSAQTAPGPVTPLPDFRPSEELPADAAVAFPTDI